MRLKFANEGGTDSSCALAKSRLACRSDSPCIVFRLHLPIDTQPTLDATTTIAERFTKSVDSVAVLVQPIHTINPVDAVFFTKIGTVNTIDAINTKSIFTIDTIVTNTVFTIDAFNRLNARINNH